MSNKLIDVYVLYRIIKDLSTPFKETEAYKLGLIDDKGQRRKDSKSVKIKAKTKEEKAADGYYQRFIRNLKKIMTKVGLGSKVATFAAALFLLKEEIEKKHQLTEESFVDEDLVLAEIVGTMKYLQKNSNKNYNQLQEEIANVTGPAVAGTGSDPAHWRRVPYRVGSKKDKRKKGKYIDGVAFLKRMAREKAKEK
jgi:hypothetical protein